MGWQKTFTLSTRAKGCHLVTDEVVRHIRDGLNQVQVRQVLSGHSHAIVPNPFTGWDVIPLHVQCPFFHSGIQSII